MRRLIEYRVPHGTVKAIIHGDIPESLLTKDAKRNARLISDMAIADDDGRSDGEILAAKPLDPSDLDYASWL